jgi:hypothetical protein
MAFPESVELEPEPGAANWLSVSSDIFPSYGMQHGEEEVVASFRSLLVNQILMLMTKGARVWESVRET